MKCGLCNGEGTVRALPWNGDVVVSVMCAPHEWACVVAVIHSDYEAVEVALRVADPALSGDLLSARASAIAVLRVMALFHTDPELAGELAEVIQALPSDADQTDVEWAALDTMQKRGM